MFLLTHNDIVITAGDTGRLAITIKNPDGSIYVPYAEDEIVLTVKNSVNSVEWCFKKYGANIVFEPEDTIDLKAGKYVYDVQITLSNGDVNTIIPTSVFEVRKGVS